jgi:hypothetical protein
MNEHRKLYVVNKFAKMDLEKQGEVRISLLKEKYNPKCHPDVISGKISDEEIYKQFCYTLDIYCSIRMITDSINYKQFIEYYNGISSAIFDENYFEAILNVWGDDAISVMLIIISIQIRMQIMPIIIIWKILHKNHK